MEYVKKNGKTLLTCLAELAVGILLFINPLGFTTAIMTCIGIVLLACGIYCVIHYFCTNPEQAAVEKTLVVGLVLSMLGSLLTFKTSKIIGIFTLLTNLYGIAILILGAMKLQQGLDMLRLKLRYWFIPVINAVLAILFAIILVSNPFTSTVVLWKVAAISLIVEAVLDATILILMRSGVKG